MPWSWACFLWLTILLGLWQCFCSLLVDSFLTVLSVLWWISSLISLVHFGCPLVYRWCLVFGGSLFSTDLLVVSLHHFLGLLGSPPLVGWCIGLFGVVCVPWHLLLAMFWVCAPGGSCFGVMRTAAFLSCWCAQVLVCRVSQGFPLWRVPVFPWGF